MRTHVLVALVVLLVLIPVNFIATPDYPWWMWVVVGWLPLLALHTVWAIGMFDRARDRDS